MADTGLLVRHVKTTLEGLENPACRPGCSTAAAGALRARVNSGSGREGAQGITGRWAHSEGLCQRRLLSPARAAFEDQAALLP